MSSAQKETGWMRPEMAEYLANVRSELAGKKPKEVFDLIAELNRKDKKWREEECINLVPSECVMSNTTRKAYGSNQMFRVCDGPVGAKDLLSGGGDKYLERIEGIVLEEASKLFGAKFVEHRPLCGNMGCMAVYLAMTKPGDRIMSVPPAHGGNPANLSRGFPGPYGLEVSFIPMKEEHVDEVDLDAFESRVKKLKPRVITLGTMIQLFPYPLEKICHIAHQVGALVFYDAAHIGAFMAARLREDPLREGVDILMVNTHKMFGGPMGCLIMTNDADIARRIDEVTYLGVTQTPHGAKIVSLAITIAEMMEYARPYSEQILNNAKTLAQALDREGIPVMEKERGFTQSHLLIVNAEPFGGGQVVENLLTRANIIGNKMPLPGDFSTTEDRPIYGSHRVSGFRIGTPQITRQGMKEEEMEKIAYLMRRVLVDKQEPLQVAKEVAEFVKRYQRVHYCFDAGR